MGNERSRQGSHSHAARTRTPQSVRLGKIVAWLTLTGTAALACGRTSDDDASASHDGADGGSSNTTGGNSASNGDAGGMTSDMTSGGTSTSSGAVTALDDLWRELAEVTCKNDCSVRDAFHAAFGAGCAKVYTLFLQGVGVRVEHAIEAGNISFDPVLARQCIDKVSATECGKTTLVASCNQMFTGQVPLDGACIDPLECAGSYCDAGTACPGTCVPRLANGATCGTTAQCEFGLECRKGVCGAPKALGEPCASDSECETHHCDDSSGTGVCGKEPLAFTKTLGEPCDFSPACEPGLYCPLFDVLEVATCTPAGEIGEPCRPFGYETTCVPGAYCAREPEAEEGVCSPEVPIGGACSDGAQCTTRICDAGLCQEYSALGGPCASDLRCWGKCEDGVCVPYPTCSEE